MVAPCTRIPHMSPVQGPPPLAVGHGPAQYLPLVIRVTLPTWDQVPGPGVSQAQQLEVNITTHHRDRVQGREANLEPLYLHPCTLG